MHKRQQTRTLYGFLPGGAGRRDRQLASIRTFESWCAQIDAILVARCGLGRDDLDDCPYRDWYADGMSPRAAASRAYRNAREG